MPYVSSPNVSPNVCPRFGQFVQKLDAYESLLDTLQDIRAAIFEASTLRQFDMAMMHWEDHHEQASHLFDELQGMNILGFPYDQLASVPELGDDLPGRADFITSEDIAEIERRSSPLLPVSSQHFSVQGRPPGYDESATDRLLFSQPVTNQEVVNRIVQISPNTMIPAVVRWLEGVGTQNEHQMARIEGLIEFLNIAQTNLVQVMAMQELGEDHFPPVELPSLPTLPPLPEVEETPALDTEPSTN